MRDLGIVLIEINGFNLPSERAGPSIYRGLPSIYRGLPAFHKNEVNIDLVTTATMAGFAVTIGGRIVFYAIGDNYVDTEQQFELFSTFENVVQLTYEELMNNEKTIERNADVVLFFPYNLWNVHVETGNDIYGVGDYGKKIDGLKLCLCKKLEQVFPGAIYVNKPQVFALERDKIDTKNLLALQCINIATAVPKDIPTIRNALEAGNCIYIKVRYGSMGKGITRLEEGKWLTNFRFVNGEIKNHHYDDQWKTIDVTEKGIIS